MLRFLGIVAFAFSGAVTTLVLRAPTPRSFSTVQIVGAQWRVLYDSVPATAAAGAIAALLVAALLVRRVDGVACAAAGLMTLVVIGATPAGALLSRYVATIAAGITLGGLCLVAGAGSQQHRRLRTMALGAGAVFGYLAEQPLRDWRRGDFGEDGGFGVNRSFADYLPRNSGPSTDWVLILGAAVALSALVAFAIATRAEPRRITRTVSAPTIVVGVIIPVAAVVTYWRFRASISTIGDLGSHSWAIGYLVLAAALVGAMIMPSRSGLVWVGVVALVAVDAAAHIADGGALITLGIAVALIAVGALLGRWRPHPLAGLAVLIVVVLVQLLDGLDSEVWALGAAVFGVPLAAAFTLSSLLARTVSVPTPAFTPALAAIASLGALGGGVEGGVAGTDFGWTAYVPLSSESFTGAGYVDIDLDSTTHLTVTLSTIGLAACAIATILISRRRGADPAAEEVEISR